MKRILCTIGPSSFNREVVSQFEKFGVDVLRINLSHTPLQDIEKNILKLRELTNLPICLDTEGAQVRIGKFQDGPQEFLMNQTLKLVKNADLCSREVISFSPDVIFDQLDVGDLITIDFNSVLVQVIESNSEFKLLKVLQGGIVGDNKAVTVEKEVILPPFSVKDLHALELTQKYNLKHIAFSFVHSGNDVRTLRKILGPGIEIISKIECISALKNLDDICRESDSILIDRGDLSRQVSIERVPATQKFIINSARRNKCQVLVATNLLESMIASSQPTRAEVNDIYNTLLDGADGLVLAAETAIGHFPAQCVSMVRRVVKVFEMSDKEALDFNSISNSAISILPPPHGGELNYSVNSNLNNADLDKFPRIVLDDRQLLDCEQIALGTFSPLSGFMESDLLNEVLERNRLTNGTIWTMPIILQGDANFLKFQKGQKVIAVNCEREIHSLIEISEIYKIDVNKVAKKWFSTDSIQHPGVNRLKQLGEFCLAGKITLLKKDKRFYRKHELSPSESRKIFNMKGWDKVVAFHTRNIPHKAHYHAQLKALEESGAHGLYITPLVGPKKSGDFLDVPILESYSRALGAGYYPQEKVLLGQFSTYPRYAGPREAVFTALCRKNMGCSHFIIGRDHSGVMSFYQDINLEKYFGDIGELGIIPIFYPEFAYSREKDTFLEFKGQENLIRLSGSDIRDRLQSNLEIPNWLILPEVADYLKSVSCAELFHQ